MHGRVPRVSVNSKAAQAEAVALPDAQSPLTPVQAEELQRLARTLNAAQRHWVSGYLAGLCAANPEEPPVAKAQAEERLLTVVYGSETGNARQLAADTVAAAEARGIRTRLFDMARYPLRELRDERLLLIVTATHGEGTQPDPALDFYEYLHGRKAPDLKCVGFAVLVLVDSSY